MSERNRLGVGEVAAVAPGVVLCRLGGRVRVETLGPMMAVVSEQIRQGKRTKMFVDITASDVYDTEARKVFQSWLDSGEEVEGIEGVWVLYCSPLMKVGLSLISPGRAIYGVEDPEEFYRAVDDAIRHANAGENDGE